MEQYIPKSALVAEIERLHKAHSGKYGCDEVGLNLEHLEDFIDTLEVKEVDDEPECKIFPRPIECYSNCKECPWLATNNKAQKGE